VTDFGRLLSILSHSGVEFIVIGGFAATAHGSAHVTSISISFTGVQNRTSRALQMPCKPLQPYPRGGPPGLPLA